MKLIDTGLSNTKIKKTQKEYNPFDRPFRISSLSLYPNDDICPGSLLADCQESCLRSAGDGKFDNVPASMSDEVQTLLLLLDRQSYGLIQIRKNLVQAEI
mgnify:CR=1 FL=1